jgi:hypothetical protein
MIINDILELNLTDNLNTNIEINDNIELSFEESLNELLSIKEDLTVSLYDDLKNAVKITESPDQVHLNFLDVFKFKIKILDELFKQGKQYTYNELIVKFQDLTQIVDNFLPDWHSLRYLQKESILDRASVARVAVALSNLLRLAVENEIDEIHLVTLRIRKIFIEEVNKDIFVITDY